MASQNIENPVYSTTNTEKVVLTDEEWKKILTPEVYHIARQKGTERPGTSSFEHLDDIGTYYCGACGNPLPNLKVDVVGQVFTNLSVKAPSSIPLTTHME